MIQSFQLGHFGFQCAIVGCGDTSKKYLRVEINIVFLQSETIGQEMATAKPQVTPMVFYVSKAAIQYWIFMPVFFFTPTVNFDCLLLALWVLAHPNLHRCTESRSHIHKP